MKIARFALVVITGVSIGNAQVSPPRPEHFFHHLFSPHHDGDDLEQRSHDLSCALVLIVAGNKTGTGFYVSPDGDVATAAHVIGDKTFIPMPNNQFFINLTGSPQISIKSSGEESPVIYNTFSILESNADQWSADVALLKTGKKVTCWLRPKGDEKVATGQHVLALGFPSLAFGSLSLYTGIVSGRIKTILPIGKTVQGLPITSNVEFIRIQMPISPGLSGAPLVDDENRVIGVVTSAGAWSQDLDMLLNWERMRESQPASPQGGNVDLPAMVGELAEMLHDYGSPGYGDAVPMRYLRKAAAASQKPAPHNH